ncbi:Major facilitator superfamily MFS_1 [Candidatus Sulfopaludibacter sp. SbA4]|nr:Major facilitator superfamily MFS_1 [Candidatus Sulfopaludibacter sp. SbA4]
MAPQLSFAEVLRLREVRRIWMAQIVSVFGDFLAVFAVFSVVTFQLHGTATQVSMILVAYMLPLAVISPLAGVFVDKWNVKWTMIASDLVRAALVLVLVFMRPNLNAIYAIFFALSTVSSFFIPAQSVAVRAIAPAAGLLAVNALMSQAVQGSQIISPAISGLLVQWFGANSCFLFDSASFVFSAAMVMSVAIHRQRSAAAAASSVLSSLLQGFRFILTHAALSFVILSMTAGMFAVRCFGALLSIYVRDVLVSTAALFGILNSLIGIGMIAGTQSIHRFARKIPQQYLVIYGLSGMGAAVFVTAVFGKVATTALGMLAIGFCAALVFIPAQTLLQKETPHDMLGRVSSSVMSLMAISQVLAMFVAGPVAQKAGIRNLYFGSAVMLVSIGAVGLGRLRKPQAPAESAAEDENVA